MIKFNSFLIKLNIFMAVINVINGLVLQRADCMMIALLNLATAYVCDKYPPKGQSK